MPVEENYAKRNDDYQVKPITINDCMYFTYLTKEVSVQGVVSKDCMTNMGVESMNKLQKREAKAGSLSDDITIKIIQPILPFLVHIC